MSEPQDRETSKSLRLVLPAVAVVLVSIVVAVIFLRSRNQEVNDGAAPAAQQADPSELANEQFARTNSVTFAVGGDESGQGLRLVETQSDGVTTVEARDGVTARVSRLGDRAVVYFYFQIHPAFKQQELRGARFDVEYLDPQPGTMALQYDAQDAEDVSNPVYREAVRSVKLGGSNLWQTASFRTKNDGLFRGRQNGRADFRLSSRTPVLYVRRVTMTLEPVEDVKWAGDFSTSNQVSVVLGEEQATDGIRHLGDEPDGRTQVETRDGVVCRHLNRAVEKRFGYLYFTLAPSFKQAGLKNARLDIEYLAPRPGFFRLQFDGTDGIARRKYQAVLPVAAAPVRFAANAFYARIPTMGAWAVATFHATNVVFQNGQNGDADFRLEAALPPEIYVRRVTVTRDENPAPSNPPQP